MAFGFPSPGTLWRLARKVEDLFTTQANQGLALDAQQRAIQALTDRVTRLESREDIVVAEAKGAAAVAASGAMNMGLSDLARRIGGLEERGRLAGNDPKRLTEN